MKKLYTLIIISIYFQSTKAQDTLRSADLPNSGSNYVLSIGTAFTGMDARTTGVNHNWDYSELGRSSQRFDTMYATSATNPLLYFYFINSPLNTNRANHATKSGSFNLGIITLNDVINYYYNSSSSYSQPGFGAVVDSVPIPIAYTPHDVLYNFPLKYGDEDSVSYSYELNLISTVGLYYRVNRSRHNIVDGWGTLTTPYGMFDVLRVKSMLIEQDSIYVDTFHFGVKTPPVISYEYKWMGKSFGLPLLQINTSDTNAVTQILYQDSVHLTTVEDIQMFTREPLIFPNPASDKIIINYSLKTKHEMSFYLCDLNGKQIFNIKNETQPPGENLKAIDLTPYKLSPGNYFLKITAGNSAFTKTLQISNK